MKKSELRKAFLAKRQALGAKEREHFDKNIADNFFRAFDLKKVATFHCFLSIPKFHEVDTRRIIDRVWADHPQVRVVVPRVDFETKLLEAVVCGPSTPTPPNSWNIPEPVGGETVAADEIDLVIVPLLCADVRGHRVGYGEGYYDRFLARARPDCIKAGISYFEPVEAIRDVHEGDIPLDALITPGHVRRFA